MTNLTTQSSLLQFIHEELVNGTNLSIRGLAKLCGVADKSLINGGSFNSAKLGQTLTEQGFEAGSLATNGFPAMAVWLTIEYYAYESKAKAEGAKQLARTFGQIGIMTTFDKLTQIPEPEPVKVLTGSHYLQDLEAMKFLAPDNETLKQLIREKMIDTLAIEQGSNPPALLAKEPKKDYTIAKVRATQLGYTIKEIANGSALGRFISKNVPVAFKETIGRYPVNHYEVNDELDTTIHSYFKAK